MVLKNAKHCNFNPPLDVWWIKALSFNQGAFRLILTNVAAPSLHPTKDPSACSPLKQIPDINMQQIMPTGNYVKLGAYAHSSTYMRCKFLWEVPN